MLDFAPTIDSIGQEIERLSYIKQILTGASPVPVSSNGISDHDQPNTSRRGRPPMPRCEKCGAVKHRGRCSKTNLARAARIGKR